MIVFQNPGLIDKDAISIVGISAKLPDAIGRFGTGIKYSIATILREGGSVTIWRGLEKIKLATRPRSIRDVDFHIVTMNGKNTGFATHMGQDWKPWMVLRELASNAMDEGGTYFQAEGEEAEAWSGFAGVVDTTTIIVEWDDLEAAYRNRGELFLEGDVLLENDDLRIVDKRVRYIYNRGIRVHELHKQDAAFAYDLKRYQMLTEDRTLLVPDQVKPAIAKALLRCEDEAILHRALYGNGGYESTLDFDQTDENYQRITPTRAFIDVCLSAREAGKLNNGSARKLLSKFLREEEASRTVGGGTRSHPVVEWLADNARALGFKPDDEKLQIVIVPELPGTAITLFEKGRIYILMEALEQDRSRIGLLQSFLMRLVEAELSYPTYEDGMGIVLPKLMAMRPALRDLIAAEERAAKEPAGGEAVEDDEVVF